MAYLKSPVIAVQSLKWLLRDRAAAKKAAEALSANFKSPKFRATERIIKYKKQKYFG